MAKIAEQKLAQAAEYLRQADIDLWLIYASEGSDPAVSLLTGLKTVGRTFFLLTWSSRRRGCPPRRNLKQLTGAQPGLPAH